MPKQTFISKDFFVDASEAEAKQKIRNIPKFVNNIKFVTENKVIQSMKFLYERTSGKRNNYVDVSVLPLNDRHTKITLHCSYTNGSKFRRDNYVRNAVYNFESAVKAVVNDSIDTYSLQEPEPKAAFKLFGFLGVIT